MSHDRHLIDTIKKHFARKSSAQLQEIVQADDQNRWSPEAFMAAREVLLDRAAGRAQEPSVVEEDPAPPPSPLDPYNDPYDLALISGLIALRIGTGIDLFPKYTEDDENDPNKDQPVPFGPEIAWLALETTDTAGVSTALGLREVRAAKWVEGIDAAYRSSVFVTPPLADWTLAVGIGLLPHDRLEVCIKPLLERLSWQFGDAQYFCTNREFELHIWARARNGRLIRGYGWYGNKGLSLWDEGAQTKEERDLGFRFHGVQSPDVEQSHSQDRTLPDEGCVMQLACLWSIDPTTLDEHFKGPVMGLLGNFIWGESQTD